MQDEKKTIHSSGNRYKSQNSSRTFLIAQLISVIE